jgi:carboxypeptidase Taq
MTPTAENAWKSLVAHTAELEALVGARGLLEWDQQVNMPSGGAEARGRVNAVLSGICHDRMVDDRVGSWLEVLRGEDLDDFHAAGVRNIGREHDRAVKVPRDLVEATARAQAAGFSAWMEARQSGDFQQFVPALEELLGLVRQRVDALVTDEACRYDVLLEEFDPGTTTAWLNPIFDRLAAELGVLIDSLDGREAPAALDQIFPVEGQRALHKAISEKLGFDYNAGRIDESEHPFTVGAGIGDIRITTRYFPEDLLDGLGGTIHETGHGLYEQGLRADWAGTGVGQAASFGLHESQSRFWENFIGRSLPFFRWMAPLAKDTCGVDVTPEALYGAANRVERSLVRVGADEATYNLHIIVRYRIEQQLIDGNLQVADLPEAWNQTYEDVVGVRPTDDVQGVLQDVHWCGGAFGYFPSYTIGNLYAASLGAKMQQEIPQMWDQVALGEFSDVLAWLRDRIHSAGHLYDAPRIVENAVGQRDHVEDLVAHLWNRHGALHGVTRPA